MLKLCNKNGPGPNEEEMAVANEEKPSKKLKKTSEDDTESPGMEIQMNDPSSSLGLKSDSFRTSKNIDEKTSTTINTTNWNNLCKSRFHIANSRRFDQLFQKKIPIKSSLVSSAPINLLSRDAYTETDKKGNSKCI